jgi:hypothetical protein
MPARNRAYRIAALIALGDNLRLLLRAPTAAAPAPGKYLQPMNRFKLRLRLKQKLSVRHMSNPLDSGFRVGQSPISSTSSRGRQKTAYEAMGYRFVDYAFTSAFYVD